jgi:glycosyltransferase involved in cell wall biosynthesis
MRRGAVTEAATFATMNVVDKGTPTDWQSARHLIGRVRETDAQWQPIVSAPSAPDPTSAKGVLYLAKESRPFLHNGFCTRTHESLQSLVRAGWDVTGVTMPGFPGVLGVNDAPGTSVVEDVEYQHLLPRAATLVKTLAFDEYVDLSTQVLAGFVARRQPALLHVGSGHRGFETALVGNAVARWARIPWIYEVRSFFETTWTADARYREQGEYYERRFNTETRMMRAANLVITLSGPMRDEIANQHGIPAENIRVVPNAVDLDRFQPRVRDEDLRQRLGLTGSFTIGYVSNLSHPREGQEVLIQAVAGLRKRGRMVTGLLVGDGARRDELELLAGQLGVRRHIVFAGNIPFDQVAQYYAQIDLFVVPRVNERAARMVSPMKPFEAMAMNIPVLVADLPALLEIAGSGERARSFRAGDPQSLAHEVEELMDAPAELARIVSNARRWVELERSWSAVAVAFGAAYEELLEARLISPGREA